MAYITLIIFLQKEKKLKDILFLLKTIIIYASKKNIISLQK